MHKNGVEACRIRPEEARRVRITRHRIEPAVRPPGPDLEAAWRVRRQLPKEGRGQELLVRRHQVLEQVPWGIGIVIQPQHPVHASFRAGVGDGAPRLGDVGVLREVVGDISPREGVQPPDGALGGAPHEATERLGLHAVTGGDAQGELGWVHLCQVVYPKGWGSSTGPTLPLGQFLALPGVLLPLGRHLRVLRVHPPPLTCAFEWNGLPPL